MADLDRDISRYLKGELTPSEMHALEKKALEDPFLEAALEGASQVTPAEFDADLDRLEGTLDTRLQPKAGTVLSLWVWPARIAAGLVFLVVATYVIMQLNSPSAQERLAVNKESTTTPSVAEDESPTTPVESPTEDFKEEVSPVEPAEAQPPVSKAAPKVKVKKEEHPPLVTEPQDRAIAAETENNLTLQEKDLADDKKADAIIASPAPARQEAKAEEQAKKLDTEVLSSRSAQAARKSAAGAATERAAGDDIAPTRIIKGRVTTADDGEGLPGVNIVIKGTNSGTVTNISGEYQISSTQDNPTLVFAFIGLQSEEVETRDKDRVNVQLQEDVTQLSEVVVTGYSEVTAEDISTSNIEFAIPSGGQRAFRQYLESQLKYPAAALEQRVEGKVTIQFTVEASGQLADFTVLRGLGYGCDEEVIRLVREGPSWSPTKKNNTSIKDKVKVRLKFSLPKKE